eukprot:9479926-Pyramimonas_sp.AAC.2
MAAPRRYDPPLEAQRCARERCAVSVYDVCLHRCYSSIAVVSAVTAIAWDTRPHGDTRTRFRLVVLF